MSCMNTHTQLADWWNIFHRQLQDGLGQHQSDGQHRYGLRGFQLLWQQVGKYLEQADLNFPDPGLPLSMLRYTLPQAAAV